MKCVNWNGIEMTTISAIADHYSDGDKAISKEIKPFIRTGVDKLKSTIKLSKEEIKEKLDTLEPLVASYIPHAGMKLIPLSEVKGLERYFILVLEKKIDGSYKKDRFKTNRTLVEELSLELKRNEKSFDTDDFRAVLSYISRLEIGQPKVEAVRAASKNFGVTQARIKRFVEDLELQIDYVNKPKDFI